LCGIEKPVQPCSKGSRAALQLQSGTAAWEAEIASRPKITFVYFDAGGGHRATMNALCSVIRDQRRAWEVECLNLQELLDVIDPMQKLTGLRVQDAYNLMLKKGWTLGATQLLPVLHGLIRLYHPRIVSRLEDYWRASRPDMVVSLIPNFNRQLAVSLRQAHLEAPFVTILTDLADYPPHLWVEPQSEYLICGTKRAVEQALAGGHPRQRIYPTSGMLVDPAFYVSPIIDRRAERESLGLEADRKTGLVLFGGQGSSVMLEIARRLKSFPDLQLIFICGKNEVLEHELCEMRFEIPVFIEGFTRRVPYYMSLANFFIGKPGPGSISEALVMGLPVIVERNARTLPQERFNADWIQAQGVGLVVKSFQHVTETVGLLLEPETFSGCLRNVSALRNRAVFEVPEILEEILRQANGIVPAERV
jgi:Monogalactosyldiacylglycerol (MGDG) synthase/Glycosyltransferase family 28 C-terminal domain